MEEAANIEVLSQFMQCVSVGFRFLLSQDCKLYKLSCSSVPEISESSMCFRVTKSEFLKYIPGDVSEGIFTPLKKLPATFFSKFPMLHL